METARGRDLSNSEPYAKRLRKIGLYFLSIWERPVSSALFAFAIYCLFSMTKGSIWRLSEFPYFNYLADAFLHGQLSLRTIPVRTADLSYFN
jgi:hypothetical protein